LGARLLALRGRRRSATRSAEWLAARSVTLHHATAAATGRAHVRRKVGRAGALAIEEAAAGIAQVGVGLRLRGGALVRRRSDQQVVDAEGRVFVARVLLVVEARELNAVLSLSQHERLREGSAGKHARARVAVADDARDVCVTARGECNIVD